MRRHCRANHRESGQCPGIVARCCLGAIWFYRHCISALKPPCCRFYPTCSQYAAEAFRRLPFWRALGLTVWRILRCHPLYHGNLIDPVPPK